MSSEFGQDLMRIIEQSEDDVASQIRVNHHRELRVVDAALEQILQGLDAFASMKGRPDNRLESARLFLATRSFNSLRTARQVLEHGYYQQASTLVRMSMEDQLIAEDAENHPPTLCALLDDNGRISRGELTYGKMAERISPEAREAWNQGYGDLSERAAHPRRMSLLALTTLRPDGRVTLRPGSHYYDEVEVKVVLYYLVTQLVAVMRTVSLLTANVGSTWVEDAIQTFDDVNTLWRQIDEWAQQQLSMG